MHREQGDDHVDREQDADGAREEAEGQQDAADQLDEGDDRSRDLGQRDAHACEAADGSGEGVLEDLLRSVSGEDGADHDAEDEQSQRGGGRGAGGVRHEEVFLRGRTPRARRGAGAIPALTLGRALFHLLNAGRRSPRPRGLP